jgi:hypothetical protein
MAVTASIVLRCLAVLCFLVAAVGTTALLNVALVPFGLFLWCISTLVP